MSRRRTKIFVFLALVLVLIGFMLPRNRGFQTTRLRLSGYQPATKNGLLAWAGRMERKLDGTKLNTSVINLGGHELLWSYSSPTSGWFQFGNLIQGSNLCYWTFALLTTAQPLQAYPEGLRFQGPDSNAWNGRLAAKELHFGSNVTGEGAIRLPVGQPLLVRHRDETNITYFVQCQVVQTAYNGDVKARFRHRVLAPERAAP